ncbi:RNase adapter RapZ [Pontibacterium granulatum]|uniref:RNase adapter RapZ n=1 Tax=Pontibacterium granulatum TaxID=2036029 RepID=UPI00249CACB2|nr:RNase adapter RapZ [Pontibacterium granulatum]MDI3323199.1 RNase adapter RapZ [Pontibacterium granulatum]
MKLVVISGRSGSGKSTALQALEDIGFYCIDNLPATLLPSLVTQMTSDPQHPERIAISIDARNLLSNLKQLPGILEDLKQKQEASYEVLYLDASEATLLKRYSSTRRKHPLSDDTRGLLESIQLEQQLLEPIAKMADLRIDTTRLNLYDLRDSVKHRIADRSEQALAVQFESFGFKHGVPLDADIVYDVRVLPNPYWIPELRQHTGLEQPVIDFLSESEEVNEMQEHITQYLECWLPRFAANNRSYITIAIGCTGGHHRSVYLATRLASHFEQLMDNVHVRHRELK